MMNVEVKQFFVKLYAIRSTAAVCVGAGGEETQVGLYHAGKSRVKKEKTEINAVPFVDGNSLLFSFPSSLSPFHFFFCYTC
jgi:hypothetical protein